MEIERSNMSDINLECQKINVMLQRLYDMDLA